MDQCLSFEASIYVPSSSMIKVGGKEGAQSTIGSGWFLVFWHYYRKKQNGIPKLEQQKIVENTTVLTTFSIRQLSVLMFACEFKRVPGGAPDNQVVFDLGAAQGQLKALGLTGRIFYGLACLEEKLLIGDAIELDLTLPSDGIKLLRLLRSIQADGSAIRTELDLKTAEQLLASNVQGSWKEPRWTQSDCIPPAPLLPDPPQTSQPGPASQQCLPDKGHRMGEISFNGCGANDDEDCEDGEPSTVEVDDPMRGVRSWASSVAVHSGLERVSDDWCHTALAHIREAIAITVEKILRYL
ncbi:hypothetical protein FRB94_011761 [Tulasnella sp. JGI-2019a]|nr:hypothetical protein FRB94_011761 [Tulasnella sp. JGI-2019a]